MADDLRLRHVHLTEAERVSHLAPAPVESLSQREVSPVRTSISPGVVGDQRGHVPSTLGASDLVGDGHQPHPQARELRLETRQLRPFSVLIE